MAVRSSVTDFPTTEGIDSAVAGPISPESPPPVATVDRVALPVDRDVELDFVMDAEVADLSALGSAERLVAAVDVAPVSPVADIDRGVDDVGVVATLVDAPDALETADRVVDTAGLLLTAVLVGPALGDEVQDASTAISTSTANAAVGDEARVIWIATSVPVLGHDERNRASTAPLRSSLSRYGASVRIVGRRLET